jgi:hypothetical protein
MKVEFGYTNSHAGRLAGTAEAPQLTDIIVSVDRSMPAAWQIGLSRLNCHYQSGGRASIVTIAAEYNTGRTVQRT